MTPALTLWVLTWGPFPRRVLVYLKLKGIPEDAIDIVPVEMTMAGFVNAGEKPDGTVPILCLGDGTVIHQSMGVLSYLEEVFANIGPNMSGTTAIERARIRDMCSVIDETMSTLFGFVWNTSKLFAEANPKPDKAAGERALGTAHACLEKLAGYANESKGTTGYLLRGKTPTLADVTLLTLLQHFELCFGEDLVVGIPRLQEFLEEMGRTKGAEAPVYPPGVVELASQRVTYDLQ
ncbi:hypothetical protein CYLTODRAFT_470509 [Cylindrobasidium torrendii FP15055 ss-10]|uniref:Glutathione S-transferase n=1 Tax=Cylindrobasidium torrendii FP15055 ss-10 TaxID=1314674 RepID=A0A0D7B0R9_9AGAR|nr:hypothetical protein CYLTODRAFT_470509 [Cylindrobasidium torrendii FP15055 ss-10]